MTATLEAFADQVATRFWLFRYHRFHRAKAASALRQLDPDARLLTPKLRRQADDYAQTILGSRTFAPWLYVYSVIHHKFREGWIPDNYYGNVVAPNINKCVIDISPSKTMSQKIFKSKYIPDIAYKLRDQFFDADFEYLTATKLSNMLFSNSDFVYFKSDNASQGQGVWRIHQKDFGEAMAARLPSGVFQKPVHQNPFFDQFDRSSTATVRVTTVMETAGRARARAAYLRLGSGRDTVVKALSSVRVAWDLLSGRLQPIGYQADWTPVSAHPASKTPFEDQVVPDIERLQQTCEQLHQCVPHAGCIGWDTCLDRDGEVHVFEWNAQHNDIKFSEATMGPCFTDLGWEKLGGRSRCKLTYNMRAAGTG